MSMHMEIRSKGSEPLSEAQLRKHVPALFAADAHASRSERYAYIPSIKIMQGLADAGFNAVAARQSRTRDDARRGFTKHLVRFRHGHETARAVGDTVPEVVLINSHDGSSAYCLMAGLFRLICLNGMTVSTGSLAEVRVSHSGGIERVMPAVIEGAYTVLDESVKALDAPKLWSRITLSQRERDDFAHAAHRLRFADAEGKVTTPIKPDQLLIARRPADTGNDLWRTFNVVQENVTRGGLTARGSRRITTRPITGIDQDVRLNRDLWALAQHVADRKAA